MNDIVLLASFSGGRTSAFMVKYLKERYCNKEIVIVFSNVGKEKEATLKFVDECDKRWRLNVVWVEAVVNPQAGVGTSFKIVNFETASRNGEPFEAMIKKFGIPNKAFSHCTRELKTVTIRKYMLSLGIKYWNTAIGIRADEAHRINWETAAEKRFVYPLATEIKVDKGFIRRWWDRQEFDLQLKDYEGNCDFCWKKSERKLLTLAKENPQGLQWWSDMEEQYGEGQYVFYRGNKSAKDILELSKTKSFRMVTDEHESNNQQSLFDYEPDDTEYECFCKSS